MDWTQRPEHYSAIQFHDDDLYDAGWEADIEFAIPFGLKSGVYAVRLVDDTVAEDDVGPTDEYFVIFCVRPAAGASRPRVAFLMPTASYMAYANHRLGLDVPGTETGMGRATELSAHHLYLQEHPEVGLSFYEVHNDGSGVFYSSRLRPVLDMQPKVQGWLGGRGSGLWQFNADTHILGWLETTGENFDVLTDDIDAQFHDLIAKSSGNRFLTAAIERQSRLRRLVEYFAPSDRSRLQASCAEHLEILDLLVQGRRTMAAERMKFHLEQSSRIKPVFSFQTAGLPYELSTGHPTG
jgi:hypothetical protein